MLFATDAQRAVLSARAETRIDSERMENHQSMVNLMADRDRRDELKAAAEAHVSRWERNGLCWSGFATELSVSGVFDAGMQEHLSIANIEMLLEASRIIHHTEFVIIGSLSVMGALREPPRAKVISIDVGFYLKRDPGRAFDLMLFIGQGSEFNHQHSNYADAVSSFFSHTA